MHKPSEYLHYARWWLKPTFVGRFFRDDDGISKRYIGQFLPRDPVILDAGAHRGADSVEMARLWPRSSVHSFEPVPAVFARLKNNTRRYRNIRCYQLALGDHEDEMEMYVSDGQDASSSLLKPKELLAEHPEIKFNQQCRVRVTTIDQWAKENGVDRVDFMWLDMQGYEMKALEGAARILEKVSAIHTEVNLKETYAGAGLYSDLRKWLESRGFSVDREDIPYESQGNVLFVRKRETR
jgi:FkbM family methyltransferase